MTGPVTAHALKEAALKAGYSPLLGHFLENYIINSELDYILEAILKKMPEKEIIIRSLSKPMLDCIPATDSEPSNDDWKLCYREEAEKCYLEFQTQKDGFDFEKYEQMRKAARKMPFFFH